MEYLTMSEQNNDPKNIILKDEEHLVLDHNYDGIQELDHPLPRWWVWLFYLSIIYAVFYAGYYMIGSGPTLRQELDIALKEIESKKAPAAGGSDESDETFVAWMGDESHIQAGQKVFVSKCAACHGDKAQGLVGPNLTDDNWLHGEGKLVGIAKVIREGVMDKGMPPWNQLLTSDEVKSTVAFLAKLHGSNPPGGKPAQGEKFDWKFQQ